MPRESQMWQRLRPHMMRRGMDPVRVENRALPGTPDVNFIEGWAELKHADQWPVRGGPLRLNHPPSTEQKVWLTRRWVAGGNAWLILRVGQEWFLFRGIDVAEVWRMPPTQDLIRSWAHLETQDPALIAARLSRGRHDKSN